MPCRICVMSYKGIFWKPGGQEMVAIVVNILSQCLTLYQAKATAYAGGYILHYLEGKKNVNEPLRPSHPSSEFRYTHVKWINTSLLFTHTLQSPSLFCRYFSTSASWLRIELCCFVNLGPGWVSSNSIHTHFTTWDFHKRHNGRGRQEESSEGFSSPSLRWKCVLWNGGGAGKQAAEACA